MKKAVALLICAIMVVALVACGQSSGDTQKDSYTIGICQLVQHPALDSATQGFKDAVTKALGDKVTFNEKNASNDIPACATIANGFVSANVDLIMANATPALQAAAAATTEIPVLGTSVTEYGVALGIKDFNGTVGGNISGTSDLAPLADQAAMITELVPTAKKVALIYCSAEANSLYQVTVVKEELEGKGLEATLFPFSDSNDMSSVVQAACADSDAIYVPTDNTVASSTEIIDAVAREKKIPVIAGEEGICAGCGIASLTISYYDIGYKTGEMAVEILTGKADISTMPIEYAPKFEKKYNAEICEDLGIEVPSDYIAIEAE